MRLGDWPTLLWGAVSAGDRPFKWGDNDCCLFAARCADAMTGSDWVADLNRHYWDRRSAISYIAFEGGVEPAVTKRLGPPTKNPRRGDVCLVETPEGYGLAVCVGATAVIPGEKGLVSKPLRDVIKCWRID